LASWGGTTVTLVHVVTLNILAPESRLYDELAAEARLYLGRLAEKYLPAAAKVSIRVRFGNFVEELVEQSRAEAVDLIVLPNYETSSSGRFRAIWKRERLGVSSSINRIVEQGNGNVIVVAAKKHVDCEKMWGRPPVPQSQRRSMSQAEFFSEDPAVRPSIRYQCP
jgi:nucleotide-binding universal stress UspA family protein